MIKLPIWKTRQGSSFLQWMRMIRYDKEISTTWRRTRVFRSCFFRFSCWQMFTWRRRIPPSFRMGDPSHLGHSWSAVLILAKMIRGAGRPSMQIYRATCQHSSRLHMLGFAVASKYPGETTFIWADTLPRRANFTKPGSLSVETEENWEEQVGYRMRTQFFSWKLVESAADTSLPHASPPPPPRLHYSFESFEGNCYDY